jgi:hypothetical protein
MAYRFLYINSFSYHHGQQCVFIRDCSGPTFIIIFRVLSSDDSNLHKDDLHAEITIANEAISISEHITINLCRDPISFAVSSPKVAEIVIAIVDEKGTSAS